MKLIASFFEGKRALKISNPEMMRVKTERITAVRTRLSKILLSAF